MRKFVIIFFIVTFPFMNRIQAQVMAAKPLRITIYSSNLHCWECKELLDKYLVEENNQNWQNGMLSKSYNLLSGEIKIQFLPDRVSIDEIRTAINNAGFDADSTKAEPTVYLKLPPSCKLISEGGGPKKGRPCHLPPM